MNDSLELQIAENQLQSFEEELDQDQIMRDYYEAEDCFKCESRLRSGILAATSLFRAEEVVATAERLGLIDVSPEFQQTLKLLYARWVAPCKSAEAWVARVEEKGYTVDNLDEFRNCCAKVQEWIERNAIYEQSQAVANERLAQEPW